MTSNIHSLYKYHINVRLLLFFVIIEILRKIDFFHRISIIISFAMSKRYDNIFAVSAEERIDILEGLLDALGQRIAKKKETIRNFKLEKQTVVSNFAKLQRENSDL